MATPKPGEIRCPTCHRSTPPAAFCTQCGSAIPPDARARPRGMDRDELQDRIRARRSGGEPFRRGGTADEPPGYERFEPEPGDTRARRVARPDDRRRDHFDEAAAGAGAAAAAGAAGAAPRSTDPEPWPSEPGMPPAEERPSLTRDRDEWLSPATPPPPPVTRPVEAVSDAAPQGEPEYVDNFDDEAYDYEYDAWEEPTERRSGAGALAILGFLALGVLALLGGALLGGVFDDGNGGVGTVSPTPSASAAVSAAPSTAASIAPSEAPSSAPSGSPSASGDPVVFPDGFVAEAQPCLPGSATENGCDSNAAVNSGSVWVWVGFENGNATDVVGATVLGPDGSTVGEGSIDLTRIGCRQSCKGWTYFPFSGLPAGTYNVELSRNGEPAASTSFEVS